MNKPTNIKQMLFRIGLAKKAGALIAGTDMVGDAIRQGKVISVVSSNDVSDNTAKRISDCCTHHGIRLMICETSKEELGAAIGKPYAACVGITDKNLSELICRNL